MIYCTYSFPNRNCTLDKIKLLTWRQN